MVTTRFIFPPYSEIPTLTVTCKRWRESIDVGARLSKASLARDNTSQSRMENPMLKLSTVCSGWCVMLSLAFVVHGQGRGAVEPPHPDNAQSLAHVQAAKKIAGNDPLLTGPLNFYCVPTNQRGQNNNAPDLEPVKLFDNLYALGNSETVVYAITTSEGIVLIDSGFENKTETVVVPQLQKLGLDPKNVKYILLGHGHADHFGGSRYFQDHYGTKVGTTAA